MLYILSKGILVPEKTSWDVRKKFSRLFLIKTTRSDEEDAGRWFDNHLSSTKGSFGALIVLLPLPSHAALLSPCPVPGWIATSSSVPSVVTFSGTLMQWDIAQLGSTRRATAKARTQPLWIYHPNKRPLPCGATQEYIKLQHNSRSLLQVFCPPTLSSQRNWSSAVWNLVKFVQMSCFIHKMSMFHYSERIRQRRREYITISKRKRGCGRQRLSPSALTKQVQSTTYDTSLPLGRKFVLKLRLS